jgi:hypothetical protein
VADDLRVGAEKPDVAAGVVAVMVRADDVLDGL